MRRFWAHVGETHTVNHKCCWTFFLDSNCEFPGQNPNLPALIQGPYCYQWNPRAREMETERRKIACMPTTVNSNHVNKLNTFGSTAHYFSQNQLARQVLYIYNFLLWFMKSQKIFSGQMMLKHFLYVSNVLMILWFYEFKIFSCLTKFMNLWTLNGNLRRISGILSW